MMEVTTRDHLPPFSQTPKNQEHPIFLFSASRMTTARLEDLPVYLLCLLLQQLTSSQDLYSSVLAYPKLDLVFAAFKVVILSSLAKNAAILMYLRTCCLLYSHQPSSCSSTKPPRSLQSNSLQLGRTISRAEQELVKGFKHLLRS